MVAGMGGRRLVSVVVFAVGGAYLGYTFGFGYGSTGLSAWVNAMVAAGLAIVIGIMLALTAVLVWVKTYAGHPARRSLVRVSAFFLAGLGSGWALSRVVEAA